MATGGCEKRKKSGSHRIQVLHSMTADYFGKRRLFKIGNLLTKPLNYARIFRFYAEHHTKLLKGFKERVI